MTKCWKLERGVISLIEMYFISGKIFESQQQIFPS